MDPTKKTARIAGLLYLSVVLTGPFVLLYVPGKLFVPGDATATASNILAHESLFRAYIVVGLVSELLFVSVVLALYRLLKGVNVPARRPHGDPDSDRRAAGVPEHGERGRHAHVPARRRVSWRCSTSRNATPWPCC